MSRKTQHKAVAKLDALYARLPTVACKGLCHLVCGPVPMATLETERMRKADAARRLPMVSTDLTCVYLTTDHRCGVYAARPLICRVWGTMKRLSCMHGCVPDRWLSDAEFLAIGQGVERVGGPLVVTVPGGLAPDSRSFLDLHVPAEHIHEVDALAEKTRSLRALYGGRIIGLTPADADTWVHIDDADRSRTP